MRFLADESCDFAVVRALRAAEHDVLAVAEIRPSSVDAELIGLAYSDRRILLTEDKDFGWLVFAAKLNNPGVILIRFPANARSAMAASIVRIVAEHGSRLVGGFVVVQPGTVRISRVRSSSI